MSIKYHDVNVGVTFDSGGGSVVEASPNQVNFIDYDGTIAYSYTAQEASALTALPSNPSHNGLVAQGWNWTLAEIKSYLLDIPNGMVIVGQLYTTQSGDTEVDVSFIDNSRLEPMMTIAVNGTITIDWGDGSTPDSVTGSSLTSRKYVPHVYSSIGNYTISIHKESGTYSFYCSSEHTILGKMNYGSYRENRGYTACVRAVRLGNGITNLGRDAFAYCSNLYYVTIPIGLTITRDSNFVNCTSLKALIISDTTDSIGEYCSSDSSPIMISLPYNLNEIPAYSLRSCPGLCAITIPPIISTIGIQAFENDYSLTKLIIPNTVTSIGDSAFNRCTGMKEYYFKSLTPPTLGTGVFQDIPPDCIIYVPSQSLSAYQSATNWSNYASYMVGE